MQSRSVAPVGIAEKPFPPQRHLPIERAQRRVVGRLASQPRYLAGGSLSLAEE
jgi:hypothetical protein